MIVRIYMLVLSGIVMLLIEGALPVSAQSKSGMRLKVLEETTNEPVVGAVVMQGENIFVTDTTGCCHLPAQGKEIRLSVKALGFKEVQSRTFSVGKSSVLVIHLSPSAKMLETVSVNALRKHTTSLQQTSVIDAKLMEKDASRPLAQMLERVPGVSMISSGSTIAKPVIQGMHSSRILLMNNGVRLESQSWGHDHAPEIDHTGSNIVEVVKGAEAVRYGYGAIGGVVLLNQAPLPYGNNRLKVSGKVNLGYATNGRMYDGAGSVEMGYRNVGLRLHGMYQKAGDYSTAEYLLNNTGFSNISFSALAGYHAGRLTATLFASLYSSRSGIYYASKISDIDQLLARFQVGRPDEASLYPFSYGISPPFQQTQHFTLKGEAKYDLSHNHNLTVKLAFQDNLRQEFENRKQEKFSWIPVQDLRLTTYNAETVWSGRWKPFGMSSKVGLSGMYQRNYNVPGTKQPAFIPNYAALTAGIFLLHKATFGDLQCEAGMRYDLRALDVKGYTSLSSFKYYGGFKIYRNFTGSLAAYYHVTDDLEIRANVGWAWRPPDINELYASGLHHGTYWVVGNKSLTSELGYKVVLGGKYRYGIITVEPSFFFQHINGYIYDSIGKGLDRFHNHPSGKYPQFVYGQDDARFLGGDMLVTVSPTENLIFTGKGEWINARNLTQGTWLPFMPSDRYGLAGNYHLDWGREKRWHASFSIESSYVTKQTHFDPAKDLAPDSPPAYILVNAFAEISKDLPGGGAVKLMFIGDNVFNTLYKEYTDRFRFYAHARGSQFSFRTVINF